MEKKWYVVHTYTGYEDKVKTSLEKTISSGQLKDKVFDFLIPTEDVIKATKNKKRIVKRKFFPGYIAVQMVVDNETYWTVRNIPGVTGFLGGAKPIPLQDEEVENIRTLMTAESKPKPAVLFRKDENVRVVEGPFENFIGVVDEVYEDRAKVKVMVTIFGRATPVELDFLQVQKI